MDGADSLAAADEEEQEPEPENVGEYRSPLYKDKYGRDKYLARREKAGCLSGTFFQVQSVETIVGVLRVEVDEPEEGDKEKEAAGEANKGEGEGEGEEKATEEPMKIISAKPEPHPECPYVRKTNLLPNNGLPMSKSAFDKLDEYDRRDYEYAISKALIPLDDEAVSALGSEEVEKEEGEEKGDSSSSSSSGSLVRADRTVTPAKLYKQCLEIVEGAKERLTMEEDPVYLRETVPVDEVGGGQAWVEKLEIEVTTTATLIEGIRDSLIVSLEKEADRRILRAVEMKKDNKEEFTEELEDRLRTHWPRRGRVETGIKQPREAELLSHEEKTWRHIQSIQERMILVQRRYESETEKAQKDCEKYVFEVKELITYITTEKFRNLAKLQGVEVKARALYISFQAGGQKQVAVLSRMTTGDVQAILGYAMDFRKVCPPQEPGVEGGYSVAEILEIEALVVGQCDEARAVSEEWGTEIGQLQSQQEESSRVQQEFTQTYEKVAQHLAMSEGLGQKYVNYDLLMFRARESYKRLQIALYCRCHIPYLVVP